MKTKAEQARKGASNQVSSVSKKSWPNPERDSIRDSLALELFVVCVATLQKQGFSKEKLLELAEKAVLSIKDRPAPVASAVLSDMWCLGELGSKWAQDPAYLDSSGHPRMLKIRGRSGSLQALAKEFFGRRPVEEVVKMGCKTRVMAQVGTNMVAHFGGCVMFTDDPLLILAHSVRSARWFLETSTYNHKMSGRKSDALPDRAAYAVVPREDLAVFTKMMREQISSLIDVGDRWLSARAQLKRRRNSTRKITVGIQAFVFQDKAFLPR